MEVNNEPSKKKVNQYRKEQIAYSDEDYISFFKFLDEIVEIINEEEKTQHQSKLKN